MKLLLQINEAEWQELVLKKRFHLTGALRTDFNECQSATLEQFRGYHGRCNKSSKSVLRGAVVLSLLIFGVTAFNRLFAARLSWKIPSSGIDAIDICESLLNGRSVLILLLTLTSQADLHFTQCCNCKALCSQ
ncbi:hypothetical protein CEXT_1631 [Caerostris extrusa]|uniref:Uncharacterized protein n=1 Tax=Caerostris extrusa TaxID=172846 RepID=A0AAV4XG12_CAEEX|nr:hypothetical protein CEXT_1631 [Caerostris extrusa]